MHQPKIAYTRKRLHFVKENLFENIDRFLSAKTPKHDYEQNMLKSLTPFAFKKKFKRTKLEFQVKNVPIYYKNVPYTVPNA